MPETQVTDRPILFSAPMVRAIRAGIKTQTRRIVKWNNHADVNLSFSGLKAYQIAGNIWGLYSLDGSGVWHERANGAPRRGR